MSLNPLLREDWIHLVRELDWDFTYVQEEEVFPKSMSGEPWLPYREWKSWEEPFKTTYTEYILGQSQKDSQLYALRESLSDSIEAQKTNTPWLSVLKLHASTLALAEFAAVIGNLRGARFGRESSWRMMSTLGALDECRHAQIPLLFMHPLLKLDGQFDWTHRLYHSKNWVSIAARHLVDELLLTSNAIEFAIATNFVFETGFTNLQFIGLSSLAHQVGDRTFEKMLNSIQSDEARHSQIGEPVLQTVMKHDPEFAQYLVDKWFWRSWLLFAVVTGFSMDYFTPLEARTQSFKEFMEEWVIQQFLESLEQLGLKRPWYWETFIQSLDYYHHMIYLSAYTYRSTVWFDFVVPSPEERSWLRHKYPSSWESFEPLWERITERWAEADPGNEFAVHGSAIIGFCDLCQLVLCGGTPAQNSAQEIVYQNKKFIFCSEPCRWIFETEPERYFEHKDVVKRVLAGEAPGNVIALIQRYFGLTFGDWGKDLYAGKYPWIKRPQRSQPSQ